MLKKASGVLVAILLAIMFVAWPLPAKADGGPMVDPNLFAKLKEGQQVAVIQFHDTDTASVDLFISILDQTGESHEIVFFVPLGVKADGFAVREQDSLAFNEQYTRRLDMPLFQVYRRDQEFIPSVLCHKQKHVPSMILDGLHQPDSPTRLLHDPAGCHRAAGSRWLRPHPRDVAGSAPRGSCRAWGSARA